MADPVPVQGTRLNELDLTPDANGAEMYAEQGGLPVRVKVGEPGSVPSDATVASAPWTQVGEGAVSQKLIDEFRRVIRPEHYGAVGDGSTDDSAAINAAITAASDTGIGVVHLLGKRYAVGPGVSLKSGVTLRGSGTGATELVQVGAPSYVVQAIGSLEASVSLTADAAVGASTIQVTSTAGLAAGDYAILSDNHQYNPLDLSYVSGEMVRILTVDSATQVTLYETVKGSMYTGGSYATANAAILRKINMVEAPGVEDLTITGDQATTTGLLSLKYCLAPRVSNVRLRKSGHYGLRIDTVRDGVVDGLIAHDLLDDLAGGHVGYGIVFAGANDGVIVGNSHFSRCRHGVTTIGGPDGFSRRITVADSVAVGTTAAGFDTHAAGDGITFSGLQVNGSKLQGIQVRSINTEVVNCIIRRCASHGIAAGETLVRNMVVRGNTVDSPGNHGFTAEDPVEGLEIVDNTVRAPGNDGIRVSSLSNDVQILDNRVIGPGRVGSNRSGITSILDGVNAGKWLIARNFIRADTGSVAYGIYMGNVSGSWAVDNKLHGTFTSAPTSLATNTDLRNDVLA